VGSAITPRCSFCGTSAGPFQEVGGLFTVLMCAACQAARTVRRPPVELLADHDPGQPWLKWGCALCDLRVVQPWDLEAHTAADHPGWVARYEVVRPYPNQHLRVVFRQAEAPG